MNDPNLENAVPIPGQSDEYSDGTLGESDQLPDNPADLPSLISDDLDRPGYDLYPREDVHRNQSLYSVSNNWNDYEGEKFDDNYNFPNCREESSDILYTSDGQETETQDVNYALGNHSDDFSPYAINNTQIGNEESWDYSVQYGIDLDGVTEEASQVSPYHIGNEESWDYSVQYGIDLDGVTEEASQVSPYHIDNEVGEINEQLDPQGLSIAWIADPQDGSTCDLEVLENKIQVNHPNIENCFSDDPIFQEKYLKALKENIDENGQPNWHYAVRDFLEDLHTPAQWYKYKLEDIKEALTRHYEVVVVGDPYYLDSHFYPDHGFHGINLTEVVVDEHGDTKYFKGIDPNFGYQEQVWTPQQIESMCVHTPDGVTSSLVLVSDNPSELLSNLSPNFINDDSTTEELQLFQNPVTEISNPGEIPGDENVFSSNSAEIQSDASSDFTGIKVTYNFQEKSCDVIIPTTSKENEQALETSGQVKLAEVSQPISTANLGWLTTHDRWLILSTVFNFASVLANFQKNNRIDSLEKIVINNNMNNENIQQQGSNENIKQQGSFAVGVNKGEIKAEKVAGTINEAQQQNLAEAAAEIQQLLEQLEKSYSTDTTTGKMALATEAISQIEGNPYLTTRILSALKTGSIKALEQFLSHPAASFVAGALEDWQKTKRSEP